ncbi:hypothetical protein [Pantanalinema sp. GBBB05]|uniref:hypothetical protein n=1 Tax=Pantanalinema sp. GBBB05 TaxID=2604139 RepID=UPI001D349E1B|nr:DUF928 domain-containing protein [Pantanalinema sp. GBBB05]
MLNFRGLLSRSVLPLVAIAGSSWLAIPSAIAQPQLSWQGVTNRMFGGKEPRAPGSGGRGGPRPADLCWITPTETLWNSRPQLVWSGSFRTVGIRPVGTETLLWRSVAPAGNRLHRLEYGGTPLKPGKAYEWVFFFSENANTPMLQVPFQLVDANQQTAIKTDLAKLANQYQKQKINTEALALQRANYFAQQQLWSDVLQEVYSVKSPSKQLQQVAQAIEAKVCQRK